MRVATCGSLVPLALAVAMLSVPHAQADLQAGLVSHWKLDDGGGPTATDSVGGNDGTLTNGPTWTSGKFCGGLDFDAASSQYVNIPADATLDLVGNATITGWFKLDADFNSSSATTLIILEKYNSNDADLLIALVGTDYNSSNPPDGSLVFKIENEPGSEGYRYKWTNQTSWNAGQWYHFACAVDGSDAANNAIFIDGVDDTDGAGAGGTGTNAIDMSFSADVNIGGKDADTAQLGTPRYFDGVIDDVRLYSRILTVSEIQTLAASYAITDLGALGSDTSLGYGINDNAYIAGFDEDASDDESAWYWDGSSLTGLGTLGGSTSEGRDINDSVEVVGLAETAGGDSHAFIWDSSSGMQDLGTLTGRSDSEAFGINESSEVAGTSLNFGVMPADWLAFFYLPAPTYSLPAGMNSLGTLGGNGSVARDVNDLGQVVGGAEDSSGNMRPFLWLPSAAYGLPAGMNDLGTLGAESPRIIHRAQAINGYGEVVGLSYTAAGDAHAFIWLPSAAYGLPAGMNDLGVLPGGDTSWAFGINDEGRVVGTSNVTGGDFHAFIWEDGTLADLNDLIDPGSGWELERATDINNDGEITGWGTNPSSATRAYLLTQPCGGAAPLVGWLPQAESGEPSGPGDGEGEDGGELAPAESAMLPLCGVGVVQFGLVGVPALIGVRARRRLIRAYAVPKHEPARTLSTG